MQEGEGSAFTTSFYLSDHANGMNPYGEGAQIGRRASWWRGKRRQRQNRVAPRYKEADT